MLLKRGWNKVGSSGGNWGNFSRGAREDNSSSGLWEQDKLLHKEVKKAQLLKEKRENGENVKTKIVVKYVELQTTIVGVKALKIELENLKWELAIAWVQVTKAQKWAELAKKEEEYACD
ncbi:hypothetical protein V6N11_019540 [Hibiscus sabdariffa]|uniref:Uncharacterized protein n=1 Tax=Hibiscus sabdariffa TaxID=183260 RepID=A0ABR2NC58_9ROSI